MKEKKHTETRLEDLILPVDLLARRKSLNVRTTFTLSEEAVTAMQELSEDFELTTKDVFEIICKADWVDQVAQIISKTDKQEPNLVIRKSFVLKSESVNALNKAAAACGIKRDTLTDLLIIQFRKQYEELTKKEVEKIDLAEKEFENSQSEIEHAIHEIISTRLRKILGDDDLFFDELIGTLIVRVDYYFNNDFDVAQLWEDKRNSFRL